MGAFLGRCQTSNTLDLSSTKNSCAFYEYTVDQWMVTFKNDWMKFLSQMLQIQRKALDT